MLLRSLIVLLLLVGSFHAAPSSWKWNEYEEPVDDVEEEEINEYYDTPTTSSPSEPSTPTATTSEAEPEVASTTPFQSPTTAPSSATSSDSTTASDATINWDSSTTTQTTTTAEPSTTVEPETTNTTETSPPTSTSAPTTTSESPVLVPVIFGRPGDNVDRPHLPPVSTLPSNEVPRSPFYYNPFSMAGAPEAPRQPIRLAPTVQLVPQITYEVTPHVVWKPVVQVAPMPYTQYVPQLPVQSPFMQVPAVDHFGAQDQPQSYPIPHIDPPMEINDSIPRRLAKTLMRNEEFANIFVDILSKELPREANLIELKEESLSNPEAITAALLQTFRKNEKFKQLLANAYAEVKGLDDKRDEFILRFVETLINDKSYEAELTNTFEEGLQSKWHDRFEKSYQQLTQEQKDKLISSWNY